MDFWRKRKKRFSSQLGRMVQLVYHPYSSHQFGKSTVTVKAISTIVLNSYWTVFITSRCMILKLNGHRKHCLKWDWVRQFRCGSLWHQSGDGRPWLHIATWKSSDNSCNPCPSLLGVCQWLCSSLLGIHWCATNRKFVLILRF